MNSIKMLFTRFLTTKRRASPLVEEGILVGLGIFCFLLLLSVITQVLDWFLEMSDNLLRSITDLI